MVWCRWTGLEDGGVALTINLACNKSSMADSVKLTPDGDGDLCPQHELGSVCRT